MNSRPARVLVLTSSLHVGGAEKHSIQLLNRLDTDCFSLFARWLKPVESLLPQLRVERLADARCLNVSRRLDRQAVRSLTALLDEHDIDVVLCSNEYPALYARLAASRASRPPFLVEVFHTTEYARLKERLQMLVYRWVFRTFDLIIYVSKQQQQYWRKHRLRATRDIYIHNGIDCDAFTDTYSAAEKLQQRAAFGLEAQDYVIAICAALRAEKAHGDFLQAVARLRAANPRVRGLIIGDGPERARIEAHMERLGLRDTVRITGFQRDIRPLICCSDVAVLTSHKIETFSIAALEAMSLGKPLVLTRVGGAAEQIWPGENGFLFEPGDIEALCAHLARLADPVLRRSMGRCAADRARRHFGEATMIQGYSEQLLRLTRERRAAVGVQAAG